MPNRAAISLLGLLDTDSTIWVSGSLSLSGSSAGVTGVTGTSTGVALLSGASSGSVSTQAAGTGSISFSGNVTGAVDVFAGSTQIFNLTGEGVGVVAVQGGAISGIEFSIFATGRTNREVIGSVDDLLLPVFPFTINWQNGVNERLQWLTDVLVSNVGNEQRRALRLSPRRQFEVDFLVADSQRTFFDLWLHRMTGTDVLVPLWHDMIRLTAGVDQGDLFIPCDPTDLEFDDGTFALLMGETPFETEKVEIISSDPAGISILTELANNWPKGTRIVPLRRAKLSEQTEMGRASSRVATISAMFNLVKSSDYDPGNHTGDTYLGIPVIAQPSHEDNLNVEYPWQFESSDNETGYVYRKSDQGRAMPVQTHIWHLKGRAAKKAFRQFLYRMKGRRGVVWLPTFAEDINIVSNGGNRIIVEEIGFALTGGPTPGRDTIRVSARTQSLTGVAISSAIGGASIGQSAVADAPSPEKISYVATILSTYRKIVGTDGAPAKRETLILDYPLPVLPVGQTQICFMDVARFDQDQVEWQHINAADGASVVKINLRRFRNDRVPPLVGSYPIPTTTMSATACGVDTGGDFGSGGIGDGGIVYPGGEWQGGGLF